MQVQMIELHPEKYAPFFTHLLCYNSTEIWGIKPSVQTMKCPFLPHGTKGNWNCLTSFTPKSILLP